MIRRFLCAAVLIIASAITTSAQDASDDKSRITLVYDHALPNVPGDRHGVSENASTTEPARLLAVFVVDTEETVLTTPYEK